MKISPILLNHNITVQRNKYQKPAGYASMPGDTVSFSAKLPDSLKAATKERIEIVKEPPAIDYSYLYTSQDSEKSALEVSQDPKILQILIALKEDDSIPAEKKSQMLLRMPNGDINKAFYVRIMNSAGRESNNYDFQVAKAIYDAAPDDETKKALLTTQYSYHYEKTPAMVAGPKELDFLLNASPDQSTLEAQIFNDKQLPPFFLYASPLRKEAILDACTPEVRKKLLSFPSMVFNSKAYNKEGVDFIYRLAPDEETRLAVLQVRDQYGQNLLHHCNYDQATYLLRRLKNYPDVLGKLLVQDNYVGEKPIATCPPDVAKLLILESPNDEVKKDQLLAETARLGDDLIKQISIYAGRDDVDKMFFLRQSPDSETLHAQLDSVARFSNYKGPVKGLLSTKEYVEVLGDLFTTNQERKELLLEDWVKQTHYSPSYQKYFFDKDCNVASVIQDELDKNRSKVSEKTLNRLGNIIMQVIEDDTTTNEEALLLIRRYKDLMTKVVRQHFNKVEEYLVSQINQG